MDWHKEMKVLIYQMGKVGSTSVYRSLKRVGISTYHFHNLKHMKKKYGDLHFPNSHEQYYIISPVRDPISRNVSAFFENLKKKPDWLSGYDSKYFRNDLNNKKMKELKDIFLKKYTHDIFYQWFDEEIFKNVGIDVYNESFNKHRGYDTYFYKNMKLLIFQSEISDSKKESVISNFLDINNFNIANSNIGGSKDYGVLYKKFKSTVQFSSDYISETLESRFCQQFYTGDQIKGFRSRWEKV